MGKADPPLWADGPGTVFETEMRAPLSVVWPALLAVAGSRVTQASGTGGADIAGDALQTDPAGGPSRGARWSTAAAGSNDRHRTGRRWSVELEPIAGATRVRASLQLHTDGDQPWDDVGETARGEANLALLSLVEDIVQVVTAAHSR